MAHFFRQKMEPSPSRSSPPLSIRQSSDCKMASRFSQTWQGFLYFSFASGFPVLFYCYCAFLYFLELADFPVLFSNRQGFLYLYIAGGVSCSFIFLAGFPVPFYWWRIFLYFSVDSGVSVTFLLLAGFRVLSSC